MALDLSDRETVRLRCEGCGRDYDRVVIFAKKDGGAYSVASAVCHGHDDREVWVDAKFGSWDEPFLDYVTMSCRVSPSGADAVDGPVASKGDANYYGRWLSREEALESSLLTAFWELVDAIVMTVPEAESIIYNAE